MALEEANKEINGDIFSRRTQLFVFEENVTEINESSRCKAVSQTHTICNLLRCCLPAECQKLPAVCSNILWMSVYGRAVCKLTVLRSQGRKYMAKQHDTLSLLQR
jgi:hypothetical protein